MDASIREQDSLPAAGLSGDTQCSIVRRCRSLESANASQRLSAGGLDTHAGVWHLRI